MIPRIPSTAIVVNQTSMIGPNKRADRAGAEPLDREEQTMIVTVIGTTRLSIEDEMVFVPSTAESTEIAGVIMLSPKKSAAPKTPRPASRNLVRPSIAGRRSDGSGRSAP